MTKNSKNERLRWGCRRGMLELDMLLTSFFDEGFYKLDISQQETFEKLLSCQDQELYNWLIGIEQPEENAIKELINLINSYAKNNSTLNTF